MFSVCIVRRGAVGARVWVVVEFRNADVVCLGLVCTMWQFSMLHLHDLQFVNAGRGCKRRPYTCNTSNSTCITVTATTAPTT